MKLFKKIRKGFTLIELVVVIAVIAILAAVSVVSYVAITNKAKQSNDQQKIDQVNLSLAALEVSGKPETMYKAVKAVEEDGFKPENFKAEAKDYTFAYKMSENRFVILQKGKIVYPKDVETPSAKADLWQFSDKGGELTDGYSYYLRGTGVTDPVTVAGGLDVGENASVPSVSYSSTASQDVVIRTYGGSLQVTGATSHINHYGESNIVSINSVAPNSFVEYGNVSMAKIKNGRIVIAKSAVLSSLHVVETNGNYDGIKVALMGGAELPEISRDDVSMNDGDSKLVLEVQTVSSPTAVDNSPEYIWISQNGSNVETAVANSGTTLSEQTIIPAASQSDAAKKVAEEATESLTSAEVEEKEEIATRYAGGKGTEKSPYLLATKHHFGSIDEDIHDGLTAGKYFKLVTDIDLGEMSPLGWMTLSGKPSDQGYTITGNESFNGNFDGDNHTLKYEMNVDTSYTASTVGLFGSIQDCVISNITLDASINCTKGTTWVGAIAGFGMSSDLKNVTVKGSVYGKHDVGGFFGYYGNDSNNGSNIFENCVNNASVTNACDRSPNYSPTGGFVGQMSFNDVDYRLTFKKCVNNAAVRTTNGGYSATSNFVGFVSDNAASHGYNIRVLFENCSVGSEASVSSTIATVRTVSNKSVYCCTTTASVAACPASKYIGITSNLCSATASPTKVYINGVQQDMSLYFVAA